MPPTLSEARAFAESVARMLDRHARPPGGWSPGDAGADAQAELTTLLDELGWSALAQDPELVACAGLGALELGRRLAPLHHVDRLLGGSPLVGDLVRTLVPQHAALGCDGGVVVRRTVVRAEPVASSDGLDVHRMLELGEPSEVSGTETAASAWTAAGVGYLAGLGRAALDLTVGYVGQRRAFGSTLAALAPVQQLLADAATAVRGVELLAGHRPDGDALAHAGPAIADACAACQQVTGAIGFTLEYPLHRYTQRARALGAWNDALLMADQSSAIAR
ncbi:MAG: acyl-CoA dehydrogenase family protein [Solirubrobacteraceae bacterium]